MATLNDSNHDLSGKLISLTTIQAVRCLLGATLTVTIGSETTGGTIVETEAYLADDPASHSYRGRTGRNASMFLPAGHAYVYRSYGVHWCFNVVTAPEGVGEAVLVRAIAPAEGVGTMAQRRGLLRHTRAEQKKLCSGPGKLCQALGITGDFDGTPIGPGRPVSITLVGDVGEGLEIVATERIGISRGRDRLYRFVLAGTQWRRWLSRPLNRVQSAQPDAPGHP
jgi:DNA-3-methyladenine glycosylase